MQHIDIENTKNHNRDRPGHYVFKVSHAWTAGLMMYLVYQAPPSGSTWGLARDTRKSLIDPGPWTDADDDPALYYYLLDFEEGWSGEPGEDPAVICWRGDQPDGLPELPSDIPATYRHTPAPRLATESHQNRNRPVSEPHRYATPP